MRKLQRVVVVARNDVMMMLGQEATKMMLVNWIGVVLQLSTRTRVFNSVK